MIQRKSLRIRKEIVMFFLVIAMKAHSQTEHFTQFANDIQITRTITNKWSAEFDVGNAFSSNPNKKDVFSNSAQAYGRVWVHYKFSPKWKFSSFVAFYYNKNVPDIGQFKSLEWRFAPQVTYYFHKANYELSTRIRPEFRYIQNAAGEFEDSFRYRQQVKLLKPINSKELKRNDFYIFVSDEIFFRSITKETGLTHFDRNRLTIGTGYVVSNTFQLELAYTNEFLPRDVIDQRYDSISFTFIFSDLLKNISSSD